MSESRGSCEFTLDSEGLNQVAGERVNRDNIPQGHLNEDGVWSCPHEAEEGRSLCIFHLPVDEKDDEAVVSAFLEQLEAARQTDDPDVGERLQQFIGAKFGQFEVENLELTGSDDAPINLGYSDFKGQFLCRNTTFDSDIYLTGSVFHSRVIGNHATFAGAFGVGHSVFDASVDFENAEFDYWCGFHSVRFRGRTSLASAVFESAPWFRDSIFTTDVNLGAVFAAGADFSNCHFHGPVRAAGVMQSGEDANWELIGGEVTADTISETAVSFEAATFEEPPDFTAQGFTGRIVFDGATLPEPDFSDIRIHRKFGKVDLSFRNANLRGADFEGQDLRTVDFRGADLSDAVFSNADLREVNLETALLSRATLFGADLRGAALSGAVLGDVRIDDETRFLGHHSVESPPSPHSLSTIRTQPRCLYDPEYGSSNESADPDKAKSVYRALEELGRNGARPRLQARCFVRRQDLQKEDYWRAARSPSASIGERLLAGARWSRARTAELVLLYGESPWRIISYSLAIIVGFALLYPLGGWIRSGNGTPIQFGGGEVLLVEFGNALYYSTLTFTALGFGDFTPVGFGRVLTTIETGLGAILLALLVFILGRRAAR